MNKKLLLFLILLLGFFPISIYANSYSEKNETTNYSVIIEDEGDCLSSEETTRLSEIMKSYTSKGNAIFHCSKEDTETDIAKKASLSFQEYSSSNSLLVYFGIVSTPEGDNPSMSGISILKNGNSFSYITGDTIQNVIWQNTPTLRDGNTFQAAFSSFNQLLEETIESGAGTNIQSESGYRLIIEDDAHLLSNSELTKLADDMTPLTKYGHIAFKTTDNHSFGSTASFAEDYYHSTFGTDSGTVFVIDMQYRNIYIFSDGDNYRIVTNSKAYSITDNVYQYATDQEYYQCAHYAFRDILTILQGNKIAEPMRYTSNVFLALTISFLLSFAFVMFKSKVRKANDGDVIKNCDINFKLGEVKAEKTGSHRVYSPVSDSSSGGGGGGGGGGSSGGGGGHSF